MASRLIRRLFAAALAAAALGGVTTPTNAADLSLSPTHRVVRVKHVWTVRHYANWRDRCAAAGYYCLYAEYGFVYHHPFDDRPIALASRRHHRW